MLGELQVIEKLPCAGAIEAEDTPGGVSSREVFNLDAREGGVAA